MAYYETKINEVKDSVFAIGEGAIAQGPAPKIDPNYQEVAQLLTELLDLLNEYSNTAEGVAEIRGLALAAHQEVSNPQPDKHGLGRLLDRMRAALKEVGPGVISVGALADAITNIMNVVQHL